MNAEDTVKIWVNGAEHLVRLSQIGQDETLNSFLRTQLHLTGTKRMCLEGGCGACIVAIEKQNVHKRKTTIQAINSCLVPLVRCNGWKIRTIENLSTETDYHHLQKLLTHFNGTQCGFCSPGMVMNMYALSHGNKVTMEEVENSFGGNICRCTGYRSILTAFKMISEDITPDLLQQYPDIEDLKICRKFCTKPCSTEKKCHSTSYFKLGTVTWIRVCDLNDLLQILKTFQNTDYMLVAGSTSSGVYKAEPVQVYVDISNIKELSEFHFENNQLTLGANMSLTDTMDVFEQISQNENFAFLNKLKQHIDLIANVPVRNLGTLAGNLMIKYHHPEFQSDIFLILETIGALLVIVDSDGTRTNIKIQDLLTISLSGKVIEKIIIQSLSADFKYESYKIMPRAQNAHALVNAGFLLQLTSKNVVKSARIIFGNINPKFVHALKTEEFLIGKELFLDSTLQKAFAILDEELEPVVVPPEPSPLFRKQLSIALFYKYILKIAPRNLISNEKRSGGCLLQRSLTCGTYEFETNKETYPVSRPTTKLEALAQVSGHAEYIIDMPDGPNQLFGAFVLAKIKPKSIIRKIDTTEAMSLKGVVAFLTKDDIPGENNFMPKEANDHIITVKEEIFCSGEVLYFNQPIGLIVATSQEIAERAANLVEVSYNCGTKQALITINDVLNSDARKNIKLLKEIQPTIKTSTAPNVIKGRFEVTGQYHYHMETQSCNVVPNESGITVYPTSQWLDLSQTAIAKTLNIPMNNVEVIIRRLGGGFGAKISRNGLISCAAAVAAHKLRKPVKIWLPFQTNMNIIGKRYPILCDYELGVSDDGTIEYLNGTTYTDLGIGGNELNLPYMLDIILEHYKAEGWNLKAYNVNTNTAATCYARAPGTSEGIAIIESIMEHTAITLNLDPIEFRIKNINKEKHALLIEFIREFQTWADIDSRKAEINKFNEENRWKKRGLSVVPMTYPFIFFASYGVVVSIYKSDGTVDVAHGGIEMGQGINTKVAQVCAFKFGIPIEKVAVKPSSSLIAPNAHMTGGSVTSEIVCQGVINACDILLERMEPIKKKLIGGTWEDIVIESYNSYINLCAASLGDPRDVKQYTIYGVCASEIEMDVLTGQHIVKRVDLLEDAGTSMNSNIDLGQVEGAFIMGLGYYTSEQLVMSQNGELLTNRTWNYKPPGAKDIPIDFRLKFPKNTPNCVGVLNAKAVSEPPLCLAVTVPLAIRNAVASLKAKESEKWFPFAGPTTVENTFLNSSHDYRNYTL